MKPIAYLSAISAIVFAVAFTWLPLQSSSIAKEEKNKKIVERTKEEWKEILSPEQFRILREAGTERPNGKIYFEFKKHGAGTYYCAGMIHPSQKMLKLRLIIILVTRGLRFYASAAMAILGMFLPVKDSTLQLIRDTA